MNGKKGEGKKMKKESKNSKAIDAKELIIAMDELEKEKGIKKDVLIESIENALITAYKRNFDSTADNVKVVMDSGVPRSSMLTRIDVGSVAAELVVESVMSATFPHADSNVLRGT